MRGTLVNRRREPRSRGAVLTVSSVLLASLALSAGPAAAATVEVRPDGDPASPYPEAPVIAYAAAAGEVNTVTVETIADGFLFTDSTAEIFAGSGCVTRTPHEVECPSGDDPFVDELLIELGDGDDSLSLRRADYNSGLVRAGEGETSWSAAEVSSSTSSVAQETTP